MNQKISDVTIKNPKFGKYLIYDIEIKKAILGKNEEIIPGIEYCEGWEDHANMGISCIGAYESWTNRTRIFMDDNRDEFYQSVDTADLLIGFNSLAFDDAVIRANWSSVDFKTEGKSYDILVEIWKACSLKPTYQGKTHQGFGLDACCAVNFGMRKSNNGAFAPVLYQTQQFGKLIDYCLNDIAMTKKLSDRIIYRGSIIDPRDEHKEIYGIRRPYEL